MGQIEIVQLNNVHEQVSRNKCHMSRCMRLIVVERAFSQNQRIYFSFQLLLCSSFFLRDIRTKCYPPHPTPPHAHSQNKYLKPKQGKQAIVSLMNASGYLTKLCGRWWQGRFNKKHVPGSYLDELLEATLEGLSLTCLESEFMAMFPMPTSIASLSSFSLFFFSEMTLPASWFSSEGIDGSKRRGPALIHGWRRHWAAVGRFSGKKSRIEIRKSVMSFASCSLKSYFSSRTLFSGQKRNRRMCLKSPYLLKKSRE